MKLFLTLILLFLPNIVLSQEIKTFANRALDKDAKLCVNDGGVEICSITITGSTGNVNMKKDLSLFDPDDGNVVMEVNSAIETDLASANEQIDIPVSNQHAGILLVTIYNVTTDDKILSKVFVAAGFGTGCTFTEIAFANRNTSGNVITPSCPSNNILRVDGTVGAGTKIRMHVSYFKHEF